MSTIVYLVVLFFGFIFALISFTGLQIKKK
jgi:hypothetical protein